MCRNLNSLFRARRREPEKTVKITVEAGGTVNVTGFACLLGLEIEFLDLVIDRLLANP